MYEEPPFMIMEFMVNGNVLDFLLDKPSENHVLLVRASYRSSVNFGIDLTLPLSMQVYQVSLGLAYLHSRDIIHGDLKAVGSSLFYLLNLVTHAH